MKICLFGISGIPLGKHNLKDPRLDQAHQLVEADKKAYAQVDVVGPEATLEADAIVTARDRVPDLVLEDLEIVETRLGRNPPEPEKTALEKLRAHLEQGGVVVEAALTPEERQAIVAHRFHTNRPVVAADPEELQPPDKLMLRAFEAAGYICFLTVGGKENRAWPIRKGISAWEAAGAIHTDLQKGFIRAEIIGFDDFAQAGGEIQAKRAGKQRLETKQYVMQDYDVVNFRFNK